MFSSYQPPSHSPTPSCSLAPVTTTRTSFAGTYAPAYSATAPSTFVRLRSSTSCLLIHVPPDPTRPPLVRSSTSPTSPPPARPLITRTLRIRPRLSTAHHALVPVCPPLIHHSFVCCLLVRHQLVPRLLIDSSLVPVRRSLGHRLPHVRWAAACSSAVCLSPLVRCASVLARPPYVRPRSSAVRPSPLVFHALVRRAPVPACPPRAHLCPSAVRPSLARPFLPSHRPLGRSHTPIHPSHTFM